MRDFVAYVEKYEPGFSKRIEGATDREILAYEQRARIPFPDDYRSFLSRMGVNDGGFALQVEATTNVRDLITYHDEMTAEGDPFLPPDCILIAANGVAVPDLALQLQANREYSVISSSGPEVKGMAAESLEKLLFQSAFVTYKMKHLPISGIYVGRKSLRIFANAKAKALALGFKPEWFSDAVSFCAERSGVAIYLNQPDHAGPFLRIAGKHKKAIKGVGDAFIRATGIAFDDWVPSQENTA